MATKVNGKTYYTPEEVAERTGLTVEEVAEAVDAMRGLGLRFEVKAGPDAMPMLSDDDVLAMLHVVGKIRESDSREAAAARDVERVELTREWVAVTKAGNAVAADGTRMLVEAANAQTAAMVDVAKAIREGTECERKAREDAAARSYSAGFAAGKKAADSDAMWQAGAMSRREAYEAVKACGAAVPTDAPPKLPTDRVDALPAMRPSPRLPRLGLRDILTDTDIERGATLSSPGRTVEESNVLVPLFAASGAMASLLIRLANAQGYDLCYRAEIVDVLKAANLIPDDAR